MNENSEETREVPLQRKESNLDIDLKLPVQELEVSNNFDKIQLPSRMIIAGPSQSGKSYFIKHLIKYRQEVYSRDFDRIILCLPSQDMDNYEEYISFLKDQFPSLEINYGMPDVSKLKLDFNPRSPKLLILDDLMLEALNSSKERTLATIFTRTSHHSNLSVIFASQDIFFNSPTNRTINRNASEIVLFKDKADKTYMRNLSLHISGSNSTNFLAKCFEFLSTISKPGDMQYLLIDKSNLSHLPSKLMVRSRIFPDNKNKIEPIFFLESE